MLKKESGWQISYFVNTKRLKPIRVYGQCSLYQETYIIRMCLVQGSGSARKYPSERLICLGLGPQSVVVLISLCISVSLSFLPPFLPGQHEMSHFVLLPAFCHTVLPHRRLWLLSNETSRPWPKTMNRHQLFFIKLVFLICHRDKKLTDHTWPPELERLGLSSLVSYFF